MTRYHAALLLLAVLTGILALGARQAVAEDGVEISPGDWRINISNWRDPELRGAIDDSDRLERRDLSLAADWQINGFEAGFLYAHQPVLVRSGDPASNGYFHQLNLIYGQRFGQAHFRVVGGLHGSSNMFKHMDFHRDGLVGSFSLLWVPEEDLLDAFGVGADYRFGRFQFYPRMDRAFDFGATVLQVRLPIELSLRDADDRWSIGFERHGEKWGTLDSDREVKGATYLSEWRFEVSGLVPIAQRGIRLRLAAGLSFDTTLRYRDLDRGQVRDRLENAAYGRIAFHW